MSSYAQTVMVFGVACMQIFTLVSAGGPSTPANAVVNASSSVAEQSNQFARDCYNLLAKENSSGNLFFCPFSLTIVLAMALSGAHGITEQELKSALHFDQSAGVTQEGFKQLLSKLDNEVLNIATRLFLAKKFALHPKFQETSESFYNSSAQSLDFAGKPEEGRKTINDFVAEKTHDKILNLLPNGVITSDTQAVMVNAIYMNAEWEDRFREYYTYDLPFKTNLSSTVQVPMMSQTGSYNYKEDKELGAKFIELPYKGDLVMIVCLPDNVDGLHEVETKMAANSRRDVFKLEGKRRERVKVQLPKFKIEDQFELTEVLKKLGMQSMFDSRRADLSGISDHGNEKLFVSKVFQKSYISVNETGTVAAAATAFEAVAISAVIYSNEPKEFIADHPFLFSISHQVTGLQLFIGHFCTPQSQ